ncbi:DUF6010 family protein [Streptomyces sp. NPDC096310]|uniref:DUF6010 family protein n=1 Tax=Streptomyces sp. NPDC096310 TaxID=3366082 RepID=UPI00382E98C7
MLYVIPIGIGILYALLMSLIREPHRRRFNAAMVAGAGAAYRGLDSWTFIGVGWLLRTAWDIVHHLKGSPLIPFFHDSSLGCAICDPVIALWCFAGSLSLIGLARGRRPAKAAARQGPEPHR